MRALVAGIGNIFLGDDAFGVEVVRRLSGRGVAENVRVRDFGIRGFDLAAALCEAWDLVILVDAVSRGDQPGSVYVVEPDLSGGAPGSEIAADAHGLNPLYAIELAKAMGAISARVLLVGCEPAAFESEGEVCALSAPVEAAVETAVETIERILGEFQESQECAASFGEFATKFPMELNSTDEGTREGSFGSPLLGRASDGLKEGRIAGGNG